MLDVSLWATEGLAWKQPEVENLESPSCAVRLGVLAAEMCGSGWPSTGPAKRTECKTGSTTFYSPRLFFFPSDFR